MKSLFISAASLAAFSVSTAVMAQPDASTTAMAQPAAASHPVKVKSGEGIYSSDGQFLGNVDSVQKTKDGTPLYVSVIRDMQMVHIPVDSFSTGPKGLTTSLTRADFRHLK